MANIAETLDAAADAYGSRLAYGSDERGLTFAELGDASRIVASRLRAAGAARVAVCGPNAPIVIATLFGAARAGATYVPLNYRLPATSIERLRQRLAPVVTADESWLSNRQETPTAGERSDTDRPAAIMFTSGSSAEPKAVLVSHEHLVAAALREPAASALEADTLLLAAPPFHLPNILVTLAAVHTGRRIVPFDVSRFTASEWLDVVWREGITHTVVVPTMLHRITQEMERTGRRTPLLRRLTYGSARMPEPVLERALRLFPTTDFSNGYGSTESTGAISLLTADDHRAALSSPEPAVRARLGSVGRALPGVEIKIVDPDGGDLPAGQIGEIWVRGPQVAGRYLDQPAQLDDSGWLQMGDQGRLDRQGYLFCAGRGIDTIISGGENIAAAEIEDVLDRHPSVDEAAVVGLPDEEWGEVIAAMVSLREDAEAISSDQLRAWVREQVGSLKTPRVILVVDDLPHTDTGKVLHREVRRIVADGPRLVDR